MKISVSQTSKVMTATKTENNNNHNITMVKVYFTAMFSLVPNLSNKEFCHGSC
jgi:hypothetical protein